MATQRTGNVWDHIAGAWTQFRGEVRKRWGKLTDDDLEEVKGRRDILAGKIQKHYGITPAEASRQIDEWTTMLNYRPQDKS